MQTDYQAPKGTPTVQSKLGELFLPLEGLIDVAAEKVRLAKEVEKIKAEIVKVEQKLANPNFTQKVPPAVLGRTPAAVWPIGKPSSRTRKPCSTHWADRQQGRRTKNDLGFQVKSGLRICPTPTPQPIALDEFTF